mgnify:CR=1 FL=1
MTIDQNTPQQDGPTVAPERTQDVDLFHRAAVYTVDLLQNRPDDVPPMGFSLGALGFTISGPADDPTVTLNPSNTAIMGARIYHATAMLAAAGMLYGLALHMRALERVEAEREEQAGALEALREAQMQPAEPALAIKPSDAAA